MKKKLNLMIATIIMVLGLSVSVYAGSSRGTTDLADSPVPMHRPNAANNVAGGLGSFVSAITVAQTVTEVQVSTPLTLEELAIIDAAADAEVDAQRGEGFSANHHIANEQLVQLYAGFATSRDGTVLYPEFFGGSYISDDGSLVLLIVESSYVRAQRHDAINELLESNVTYRFVEFSYAELRAAANSIFATVLNMSDDGCVYANNVTGVGLNPSINGVVVYLEVYDRAMIAGFRQYIYDSPLIGMFMQLDGVYLREADYSPFRDNYCIDRSYYYNNYRDIHYQNDDKADGMLQPASLISVGPGFGVRTRGPLPFYATVGFRVRCDRTGARGFISAGHAFPFIGNDALTRPMLGGVLLGTTRRSVLNPTADFAFIGTYTRNAVTTNTLPNGQSLGVGVITVSWQNQVSMAGANTGGVVSGIVHDVGFSFACRCCRTIFNNVIRTDISVLGGDSGGPVFAGSNRNLVGTVLGGGQNQMIVLPANRILNAGFSRY